MPPDIQRSTASSMLDQVLTWYADKTRLGNSSYVIVDAAQNKALWLKLAAKFASLPILEASEAEMIPHLVALPAPDQIDQTTRKLLDRAHSADLSVLCSTMAHAPLRDHLRAHTAVRLSGGIEMLLAFWDPAILGTLIGHTGDDTLHVKGPVLLPEQKTAFLHPISAWCYRDREENVHCLEGSADPVAHEPSPLVLDQAQEDALVEAGVPDQLLYHLETNRPTLFDPDLPHHRRYRFVRAVLPSARQLGLTGMRDLTNFVAICLIYRQRIQTDPEILQLLDQVQKKKLSFDEALAQMPE